MTLDVKAIDLKALVFDVFGTVVDWRNSIAQLAEAYGPGHGMGNVDWIAFAEAWRAEYQPAMERVRAGEIGFVKLDVLHRMNLVKVLGDLGIDHLSDAEIDEMNLFWHQLDPWPDVVAGMNRLKTKYTLGTLSNGNVSLMVNMAKRAGLPWDVILGAEIAGDYKPKPIVYQNAVELLGWRPEQVMLVAAHNGDLLAARAEGMSTGFVSRPTEYGPNQTIDVKAEHDFEIIAEDFGDLARQLGV